MKELGVFYYIVFHGIIAPIKSEFYMASTSRCEKS